MALPLYNLDTYNIILASQSPRRKELIKGLGLLFEVRTKPDIDESFPPEMDPLEVPEFLALKKANEFEAELTPNDLLITADTIVTLDGKILGKPTDRNDAINMLTLLSGGAHKVITGVSLKTIKKCITFKSVTEVVFDTLSPDEIEYYVDVYRPFDKAGSYGIQEWIGFIGIKAITGSYFNVMGLPVQKLYQHLKTF